MMNTMTTIKKQGNYLLLAMMILAFSACNNDDDGPNNPVSVQDRSFALNATYSNLAEIGMGELAVSEATDESVQDFAEMMVNDHTNAQNQLANLSESLDIAIPDTLKSEHRMIQSQLSGLDGGHFDSAYITSQVTAHQEAQQIFQTQIDQGLNPQLIEYASSTLPHIVMHLERAMELKEELIPSN
jgi:putative membrane protein